MPLKNPIALAPRCFRTWRQLRVYPGVFSFRDACRHVRYVLQPNRITQRARLRVVARELNVRSLPDGVHEMELKREGLVFYWLGGIHEGLGGALMQEIDPEDPHYYMTLPVRLESTSLVMDVGACEGLFALRATRKREVARVVCFEPASRTAALLCKAAERNGVADRITVEVCAVGNKTGDVYFSDDVSPEGNRVVNAAGAGAQRVRQVTLDDYCQAHDLKPGPRDLIKIDAEGADVDVIRGAERIIRERSPQVAVTTYHDPGHAAAMIELLRTFQPAYRLRLKGMTLFNTRTTPRPILLQAALP